MVLPEKNRLKQDAQPGANPMHSIAVDSGPFILKTKRQVFLEKYFRPCAKTV